MRQWLETRCQSVGIALDVWYNIRKLSEGVAHSSDLGKDQSGQIMLELICDGLKGL